MEMSQASNRLRHIFERRYIMAFILLAAAATVSFIASYRLTERESFRAEALIMVTEQRAHSQRIAFLIRAIGQTDGENPVEELRTELSATIEKMSRAHKTLVGDSEDSRVIKRYIAPLHGIYRNSKSPFDEQVLLFLENARIVASTSPFSAEWGTAAPLRNRIIIAATNSMLQTHGLMVMILEAEAHRDVAFSKIVTIALWTSTILLLVFVTFVIFRPMRREISRAFQEVEGARERATHAEEAANIAKEAKGNFFQAASHELRTPLNAILGMSDVIKSKCDKEFEKEVEQISAAGDHLLSILNNILDAHKMTEEGLSTVEKPFHLSESFKRVVNLAETLANQKHLGFDKDIDIPDNLVVQGDATRLEQVLVNVLDNATKFTNDGKVSLHAHVEGADQENACLHVAVTDSGIGIEPEKLKTIFDQYAAEASTLSRSGGLGVGLSVAKELIELMGGNIDVQSTLGEGSKFLITLPFEVNPMTFATQPKAANSDADSIIVLDSSDEKAQGNTQRRAERRSFSVLIVDDNMANRMVAEALLKPLGGVAQMAVDGRQAVHKAEKDKFDIIFMDISMPVMDGIEATTTIRAGSGLSKETPIVALTAHVDASEIGNLRTFGFQDIITKPVRKETLIHALDVWLSEQTSAAEEVA